MVQAKVFWLFRFYLLQYFRRLKHDNGIFILYIKNYIFSIYKTWVVIGLGIYHSHECSSLYVFFPYVLIPELYISIYIIKFILFKILCKWYTIIYMPQYISIWLCVIYHIALVHLFSPLCVYHHVFTLLLMFICILSPPFLSHPQPLQIKLPCSWPSTLEKRVYYYLWLLLILIVLACCIS